MFKVIAFSAMMIAGLTSLAARGDNSRVTESGASPPSAKQSYNRHCSSCHGRNGLPRRRGVRNLTDADWHERVSDERIFNVITNGKGKMPGFSKKLSDAEIDALVAYVRGLRK
jgi:mono/diheme cytochrome c family protein